MAKLSDAFPSKYLKADVDVPEEGTLPLTIRRVEFEEIGQGKDAADKLVVYFEEASKGLVLNKTNATTISGLLKSDDTDDWAGHKIALISADVQYGTEMMRGIRVSKRLPKDNPSAVKPAAPTSSGGAKLSTKPEITDQDDSDIPFVCPVDIDPMGGEMADLFGC
jgi:hypothetical protein